MHSHEYIIQHPPMSLFYIQFRECEEAGARNTVHCISGRRALIKKSIEGNVCLKQGMHYENLCVCPHSTVQ